MAIELGTYRHFKGMQCEVIAIAKHSETLEEMVVYRELDNPEHGDSFGVRPKDMFEETVVVDGTSVPRFQKI